MRYLFYDDETQGAAQLICQIGAISTDEKGHIISSYQTLVNPRHSFDWYVVKNIHHITPEMVAHAPIFPTVYKHFLAPALKSHVLVAHNAKAADLHHIQKSLAAYGIACPPIRYIDTQNMAAQLFGRTKGATKLANIAAHYGIEDPAHHDALNDAQVLRKVFLHMLIDLGLDNANVATFAPKGVQLCLSVK